jgi:hypothetical protein
MARSARVEIAGLAQLDLAWDILESFRNENYVVPSDDVELRSGEVVHVSLTEEDIAVARQVDAFLRVVAEENLEALTGWAESAGHGDDPNAIMDLAWAVLDPMRQEGYGQGRYTLRDPIGEPIAYCACQETGTLLKSYDMILSRIYEENRETVDRHIRVMGHTDDDA